MSLILMGVSVLVVLFIIRKIYIKNWSKGIEADIEMSEDVTFPGEELILTETIVNRNGCHCRWLWLNLRLTGVFCSETRS